MVVIREYSADDITAICELMIELGYRFSNKEMENQINLAKNNKDNKTIVAEVEKEIVGMIGVSSYHSYEYKGKIMHIQTFIVKEKFRNQGIGNLLFSYAEKYAMESKSKILYLTSGIKDERKNAHEFYKRKGMEVTGYRFVKEI